jgi:flavin-dependent dehydrogenase
MEKVDVAIIGGGPAGSTAGTLLKKYRPDLSVVILEREAFPREHVGESQLPPISQILHEMGVWDKVEAADFPIKIGATYRWGNTRDLWDFELYPATHFVNEPRPAKFVGQRTRTAFQVDRAAYDEILLNHAESLGCDVRQQTKVMAVHRDPTNSKKVAHLELDTREQIQAKYYIDATGASGLLRRAMEVGLDQPTSLRNVAFWDYWVDADWAITIGAGATRVQVISIGYGWLWFIPVSPTKTSLGLVVPAEYYKSSGMKPQEIYDRAVREDPLIASLIKKAKPAGELRSTKDWSFVAESMAEENWFLAGDSGGFADPILAAGMTLAHAAARDCAYTVLELERGEHPADWLRSQYTENQRTRILQHIRFADFWYAGNGCFTDLKQFTTEIAKDAGLSLTADEAFQWLGTGGFVNEQTATGLAGFALGAIKDTVEAVLLGKAKLELPKYNRLHLNLDGAVQGHFAQYVDGRINSLERFERDGKVLPCVGMFNVLRNLIQHNGNIDFVVGNMIQAIIHKGIAKTPEHAMEYGISFLETMVRDGWVVGEFIEGGPVFDYNLPQFASTIHFNRDTPDPKRRTAPR